MSMIQTMPQRSVRLQCAAVLSEVPSHAPSVASAWSRPPGGVVDGGEIVILAIKPSTWRPVFESAPFLVMTTVLAGVLLFLGTPIPGLSLTLTCQAILFVGALRLSLAVLRWIPAWYLLTNRRVISIQGIRDPRIVSHPLLEVRNTYLQASTMENWASLGTITFVTDHPDRPPHVWRSIAKSQEVHTEIRRAIENAIDRHGLA